MVWRGLNTMFYERLHCYERKLLRVILIIYILISLHFIENLSDEDKGLEDFREKSRNTKLNDFSKNSKQGGS